MKGYVYACFAGSNLTVPNTMSATKWRARTISDLMIEVWEALDCESVGSKELEQIQQAYRRKVWRGRGAESRLRLREHWLMKARS